MCLKADLTKVPWIWLSPSAGVQAGSSGAALLWSAAPRSNLWSEDKSAQKTFNQYWKKCYPSSWCTAMFSRAHLSRYVLLITQAGGVGILSPNTVHGVVYLRSCPAVYLERRGYPLKRMSLDPTAKNTGNIIKRRAHLVFKAWQNAPTEPCY